MNGRRQRVLITTTRRPTPRTRSLVKDLVSVIPGAVRLTRGHYNMEELSFEAVARGAGRVLIIGSRLGNPSIMRFYRPEPPKMIHLGSLIIRGLALSREIRTGKPRSLEGLGLMVYPGSSEDPVPRVTEILMEGLMARLSLERRAPRTVLIVVDKKGDDDEAVLTFWHAGSMIGPRLRVVPTRGSSGEGGGGTVSREI